MRRETRNALGLSSKEVEERRTDKTGARHTAIEGKLRFFAQKLDPDRQHQAVWRAFEDLAEMLADAAPWSPEMTQALQKLLEAKDAAARAVV